MYPQVALALGLVTRSAQAYWCNINGLQRPTAQIRESEKNQDNVINVLQIRIKT